MIPRAYITEWRIRAPWKTQAMVEQDLIINRALVDIFSDPFLKSSLVFRGGTALHKLFFDTPLRYSEDIDLVQKDAGPIGPIFNRIRERLGEWLGDRPIWKLGPEVVKLTYRVDSEDQPEQILKFKIEINSREHFHVLPLEERRLEVIGGGVRGRLLGKISSSDDPICRGLPRRANCCIADATIELDPLHSLDTAE
jgi:hypothetical protein